MKFILIVTEEASEKTKYFGPFNSGEEASQWGLEHFDDDYILMSTTLYPTIGEKMNLIRCFSNVIGHKEAQEIVTDLNQMKSDLSENFYIEYDKSKDYHKDDTYMVIGNVTEEDWEKLNLDMDFMGVDLI